MTLSALRTVRHPSIRYTANGARYLRWRQARATRYWAIDRHWYRLLGWLGEGCERVDARTAIQSDRYGQFDRALLLRNLDASPSTLLIESDEIGIAPKAVTPSVAMELFRARRRARALTPS